MHVYVRLCVCLFVCLRILHLPRFVCTFLYVYTYMTLCVCVCIHTSVCMFICVSYRVFRTRALLWRAPAEKKSLLH